MSGWRLADSGYLAGDGILKISLANGGALWLTGRVPALASPPPTRKKKRVPLRSRQPQANGKLAPHLEAFAKSVAEGVSGAESYRKHVAVAWVTTSTSTTEACKLLSRPDMRQRIEQLRVEAGNVLDRMGFTKDTALRFLAEAVTVPVGELTEDHPHAQELVRTRAVEGETEWEIEKIKGVNKLDAIKQLATMAGWNAPEKLAVLASTSADVNAALDKFFEVE